MVFAVFVVVFVKQHVLSLPLYLSDPSCSTAATTYIVCTNITSYNEFVARRVFPVQRFLE